MHWLRAAASATLIRMPWQIAGQVGTHAEPGTDASGWVWELQRGEGDTSEVRRVFVEVSGPALASSNLPSTRTMEAIKSEGRSEVERVAALDDPPRVIKCSTDGVRDVYPDDAQ